MPNANRLARINEELLRELGVLIPRLKDPRIKGLVSVTRVDASRDMHRAKVYVSVLSGNAESGGISDVVKGLTSASGFLRRELGAALSLRVMPELQFLPDSSIEQGTRILDMMQSIREENRDDS